MKQVRIKNIQKVFFSLRRGKVTALRNINLEIRPGGFFVLLGPSGCGKSTLLEIISGIEKPTEGEIWIGDRLAVSHPQKIYLTPRERDIAMVFQSYALYPHMTAAENMAFPLKIGKVNQSEIEARIGEAAKILEISHLLDAKPGELSGGQRQRVALGRAIVRKPNVLLLDEPLSNLDALLRTSMRGELKQIQRRLKVTTIYVTHDQAEAMSLGDEIAVLKEGVVQQWGTPDQVYNDPQNQFVAKFMGTPPMNFFDGRLLKSAERPLDLPQADPEKVILGLRPEHIRVTSPKDGIFRGRLNLISPLGSEILLYITMGDQQIMARAAEPQPFQEKQEVGIDFDRHHLYLFDKESGKRLAKGIAS